MPKHKYNKQVHIKNKYRKINYIRGRFGRVGGYNWFQVRLIMLHVIPDRTLAKLFRSSTNGIQSMRWRIKNHYKGG